MRTLQQSISCASALALLVVLAACGKPPPEPEPVRAVRTRTVVADAAGGTKEFAAEIRARTEVRLSFRVAGKITQRSAEIGQVVRAGQVLAQLDPEDLRQGQQAALAGVAAADASFEQQSGEYKRFKDLKDQGFISSWDLERRGAALKAAQAQLDQARAQARVQRNQAAYATLLATAAGVVTGVDAEAGAVVAAGTPVLRLAVDGPRDVVFSVPEDGVAAMRPLLGRAGAIGVRMWGDNTLHAATLRELAASADPMTRTFAAKADVGKATVQLGQTATVLVEQPRTQGVVKLPLTAIVRLQDRAAVWVVDKPTMKVKQVTVAIGGADGNEVVVTGGLTPGQEVVIAGVHVLSPDQQVKFYNPSAAAVAASAVR
jgi:membrane fusion protein, multidrug efflux system